MSAAAIMGALWLLAQAQTPASTPPTPPPAAENEVEGVVVEGRRLSPEAERKAVAEFVEALSAPTHRGRLARWEKTVCPGVVGLPVKYGGYVVDRIALEAQALGIKVGEPGCRPDILVLVTDQAEETAKQFYARHWGFFAAKPRAADLLTGGGGQKLNDFLNKPRAIRWWHVAQYADLNRTTGATRLASRMREDLSRVLIIVDTAKLKGVTYGALGDYLTMVALAQLDPDGQPTGLDSITTLFASRDAGRTPPEGMTAWDRSYLKGLYEAPEDARSGHVQQGAIRDRMKKDRKSR